MQHERTRRSRASYRRLAWAALALVVVVSIVGTVQGNGSMQFVAVDEGKALDVDAIEAHVPGMAKRLLKPQSFTVGGEDYEAYNLLGQQFLVKEPSL